MNKLSDYLIISDVDGTLLNHEHGLPQRNADAIRRFTAKGGRFGIATGRSRGLMREAVQGLSVNAPCVLYNGGALYDYVQDKTLWECHLPEEARDYILTMMDLAPETGVMVIADDSYFQVRQELAFASYFEARGKDNFKVKAIDEVQRPWYKVLFQVREESYERFMEIARGQDFPGVSFVGTNVTLIEMLPAGCNKGVALEKLVEQGFVTRDKLVAVGDFYNDREMIEYAGIGVTLSTSPDDLKALADVVVGDCKGGAVADAIEHIESLCGE